MPLIAIVIAAPIAWFGGKKLRELYEKRKNAVKK
jgi:hypothetical protein